MCGVVMVQRIVRVCAGIGALIALLALVVGLPLILWAFAGNPIPTAFSLGASLDALSSPDKTTLVLTAVRTLAWIAWAIFTISTVIELVSATTGRAARRLPGFGWSQRSARGLISVAALAVVAISGTAPAMAVTKADPTPPSPRTIATATQQTPSTHQDQAAKDVKMVKVRQGDTLWAIAESRLGNGAKWPRLAKATKPIEQPDGRHLTDPDLIYPGWNVAIPTSTSATPSQAPKPAKPANDSPTTEPRAQSITPPTAIPASPQAAQAPAAQKAKPTTTQEARPAVPAPPAAAPAAPAASQQSAASEAPTNTPTVAAPVGVAEDQNQLVMVLGVGSVFAAGFVSLLAMKRRRQRAKLTVGQQIPLPTGDAAEDEQQLQSVADIPATSAADRALRAFCAHVGETNQAVPTLRAARMTRDQIELYFDNATPSPHLPAPWAKAPGDDAVFTFDLSEIDNLPDAPPATPAPYPALVVIGTDDDGGQIMVDLETACHFHIVGTPTQTEAVALSMAVELGTSTFADHLRVMSVQSFAQLPAALGNGAVVYFPELDSVLSELEHRATIDRDIFMRDGVEDLAHARSMLLADETWAPDVVITSQEFTAQQRDRVERLFDADPKPAIAVVTQHEPGTAPESAADTWQLTFIEDDRAVLEPFGLHIRPQMVAADLYDSLLIELNKADHPPIGADPRATIEPTIDELPPEAVVPLVDDQSPTALPIDATDIDQPTSEPDAESHNESADSINDAEASVDTEPTEVAAEADHDRAADSSEIVEPATASIIDLTHEGTQPRLLLLGPVEMTNAPGIVDKNRIPAVTELAAFVVLYPGATPADVDRSLWPGNPRASASRRKLSTFLRTWLGTTEEGTDRFPKPATGQPYELIDVQSDWTDFLALLPEGAAVADTADLQAALQLVRGVPISGVRVTKYGWAEYPRNKMIAGVVEAAIELANRQLRAGDYASTVLTASQGLSVAEENEALWRVKIKALSRTDREQARHEARRLVRLNDELGCEFEPETEELVEDMLMTSGVGTNRTTVRHD